MVAEFPAGVDARSLRQLGRQVVRGDRHLPKHNVPVQRLIPRRVDGRAVFTLQLESVVKEHSDRSRVRKL